MSPTMSACQGPFPPITPTAFDLEGKADAQLASAAVTADHEPADLVAAPLSRDRRGRAHGDVVSLWRGDDVCRLPGARGAKASGRSNAHRLERLLHDLPGRARRRRSGRPISNRDAGGTTDAGSGR